MPREKSAGAVVFRKKDNKIYYLLLHYEAGHWDFPKGHIEKGESEEETAKREVREETGIEAIKIIKGFKELTKYFFRDTYNLKKGQEKPSLIFKTVVFYLAETKTKEVKISFEHIGYKWLPYEQSLEQLTFKKAKEILKKANQFLIKKN